MVARDYTNAGAGRHDDAVNREGIGETFQMTVPGVAPTEVACKCYAVGRVMERHTWHETECCLMAHECYEQRVLAASETNGRSFANPVQRR